MSADRCAIVPACSSSTRASDVVDRCCHCASRFEFNSCCFYVLLFRLRCLWLWLWERPPFELYLRTCFGLAVDGTWAVAEGRRLLSLARGASEWWDRRVGHVRFCFFEEISDMSKCFNFTIKLCFFYNKLQDGFLVVSEESCECLLYDD